MPMEGDTRSSSAAVLCGDLLAAKSAPPNLDLVERTFKVAPGGIVVRRDLDGLPTRGRVRHHHAAARLKKQEPK